MVATLFCSTALIHDFMATNHHAAKYLMLSTTYLDTMHAIMEAVLFQRSNTKLKSKHAKNFHNFWYFSLLILKDATGG